MPYNNGQAVKQTTGIDANKAFWISLVLAFLVLAGWSFASPHMASPDEPAHAAKAAATVRGEFMADESEFKAGRGTFVLPALFQRGWELGCFAFHPDTPANCVPAIEGDLDTPSDVQSHVARYNPLYYALIGIPSLFPLSEWTFVAMRLVSAAINAVLIALTMRVLVQLRRPTLPLLGAFAAMTPMALFIGSSMTPQGPEIFGSLLVTVTLLALVFEPQADLLRSRAWILVVGTAFFALARGLSPVYMFILIVVVLAVAPSYRAVGELLSDRRFWLPLGLCAGLTVTGLLYTLLSGSLALGVVFPDPTLTGRDVVVQMVRNTDYYFEQILGTFGWGDTHLPMWVLVLIGGTALLVGTFGVAFSAWRGRVALAGVLLLSLGLPILVQLASFHEAGLVWQGKYVLPLAMMAPVLAGFLAAHARIGEHVNGAILRVAVAVVAFYQVVAITVNLHRYINGASGPWFEIIPDAWMPMIPLALVLAVFVAAWVVVVVLVRSLSYRAQEWPEESSAAMSATRATSSSAD
ncbi:DUF2142 domain-containing protein [Microbacterium sp.]|uniref:DUF2142 domain-containing protein n=1 Tax=Microbacterium sp. TaxID=51671 RepID=UPI003C29FF7F